MKNARTEFENHIKGKDLMAAQVTWDDESDQEQIRHTLFVDFTNAEKEIFLESLNFQYDSGFGTQKVDGTIWFKDGTFSERGEYDGSEWWDYHKAPPAPVRKE